MLPKNPLDAILSEVLGDDGGLLMVGRWPEDGEAPLELGTIELDEPSAEGDVEPLLVPAARS